MRPVLTALLVLVVLPCGGVSLCYGQATDRVVDAEKKAPDERRMGWWREARFGLFIHWGLYAIPAGEWKGETRFGEWIRHRAKIPLAEYDQFREQFNPSAYDPDQWARLAKAAGMKYLVITSKHHDGFCLWPSSQTDFDVENTPYGKDLIGPLKAACDRHGLRLCFYHSIMDWHHPDCLPRRSWEESDRPAGNADYDRYATYMKAQLAELVDAYGPVGVMWFDGEWEDTWTHDRGVDLYDYVRGLQADILVNNRVDKGRKGKTGFTTDAADVIYRGDFGTPEQKIPATGVPGVDWETCMTMNRHWGWNRHDQEWKSRDELIHKLIDVASKGGNFLLNVGPKADGTFPDEAIDRLEDLADWMEVNSESIHGTSASPFTNLTWGRCTQRRRGNDSTLYLHVFDWPDDGRLRLETLGNKTKRAYLLASRDKNLMVEQQGSGTVILLPPDAADPSATVVALELVGEPIVSQAPKLSRLQSDSNIAAVPYRHVGRFAPEEGTPGPAVASWQPILGAGSRPTAVRRSDGAKLNVEGDAVRARFLRPRPALLSH